MTGTLAQLVEHRTENPGVPGSIPGGTTILEGCLGDLFYFIILNMKLAIIYLIIVNIITAILFCADKRKAQNGKRRIPESILHLFELVGGIFTIIPLMLIIRHKTQKWSYKLVSFIILALWIFFIGVALFHLN